MNTLKEILITKELAHDAKCAESLIMEGRVKIDDEVVQKAGTKISNNAKITVIQEFPYVSRGGLKIEGAFEDFNLSVKGKKIMDVGASTGGFTDFLLQNGANAVIAVDVGYGILSWKLRNNPAVTVMERTNIRNLEFKKIPYLADLIVADVSFISLKKIFEKIFQFTRQDGEILLLIKPQFEVARNEVENKGVIKSAHIHKKVLQEILEFFKNFECKVEGLTFSKIKGAKGNIEFWVYLKKVKHYKSTASVNFKKIEDNYDKIITVTLKNAEIFFNAKESLKIKNEKNRSNIQ